MKVTKEEKKSLEEFTNNLINNLYCSVENNKQHKFALYLVESGVAKVTAKKNYGRIAEIELNLD